MTTTMSDSKKPKKMSAAERLKIAEEFLNEQRIMILYLNFDVEATRRERDFYKKKSEGK